MFTRPKSYLKPKQHYFSKYIIYQRTSPRGTGTRSSERSVPSRRRVARAGVRDAGGRRRTSPKNHLKTNFLFASTFIMFARHLINDELKLFIRQAAERKIDIRKSSISHAVGIYLSQMLISFLRYRSFLHLAQNSR